MLRLVGAVGFFSIGLVAALAPAPAHAQSTRTWVSGVGDDQNPCSRTAPCKTFGGAISKTAAGGYMFCLDSAGFGPVTIAKSLTIDCSGLLGSVLASGTSGININAAATDSVTLRGLSIESAAGAGIVGINVVNVGTVHVEGVRITGFRTGTLASGIRFAVPNGAGSELNVSDTTIVDSGNATTNGGILVIGTGTGSARVNINRVQLSNNTTGLFIDGSAGAAGGRISLLMRDSTSTGNNNSGLHVLSGATATLSVLFDNVSTFANATGLTTDGAQARVLITRLSAVANNVGLNTVNGGQVTSYLDNHINNNFSGNGGPTNTQTPQ